MASPSILAPVDPADILANQHVWEQNIYYCSDVQAKGKYGSYAKRLWAEHNVALEMAGGRLGSFGQRKG